MTLTPPPATPSRPLNVGDVINAGFRLYANHLKQYFGIALRATLWQLLMVPAAIPLILGISSAAQQQSWTIALGSIAIFLPIFILLSLYGVAKYLTNAALIARLAFFELKGQPESLGVAQRQVSRKMWRFLLASLLVGLIGAGIVLIVMIGIAVLLGIPLVFMGGFTSNFPQVGPVGIILAIVVGIAAILSPLIFLVILIWFSSRFLFPDTVLAVEDNVGAIEAIQRCWGLTQNYVWRIALIISVAFIVTLPIVILFQTVSSIFQPIVMFIVGPDAVTIQVISALFGYVVGFLGGIFILPFWQVIKAIIYYDLRARKEGLDLQLRDR